MSCDELQFSCTIPRNWETVEGFLQWAVGNILWQSSVLLHNSKKLRKWSRISAMGSRQCLVISFNVVAQFHIHRVNGEGFLQWVGNVLSWQASMLLHNSFTLKQILGSHDVRLSALKKGYPTTFFVGFSVCRLVQGATGGIIWCSCRSQTLPAD